MRSLWNLPIVAATGVLENVFRFVNSNFLRVLRTISSFLFRISLRLSRFGISPGFRGKLELCVVGDALQRIENCFSWFGFQLSFVQCRFFFELTRNLWNLRIVTAIGVLENIFRLWFF